MMADYIERQAAVDMLEERLQANGYSNVALVSELNRSIGYLMRLPSADVQPVRRYTKEELRVFRHGISLSLLSKRSSQHWQYDEDTATEIKFLERLYDKVSADMKGGQG